MRKAEIFNNDKKVLILKLDILTTYRFVYNIKRN